MYVPDWLIVLLGCGLFAALLSLWKIAPKKNVIRGAKESPERLRAKTNRNRPIEISWQTYRMSYEPRYPLSKAFRKL